MSGGGVFPVVKIEIEGMRYTIARAMSEHFAAMDAGVQEALEAACKNFDYRGYVVREASACIERALSEAIKNQFRSGGAGYDAVQVVAEQLAKEALKFVAGREPPT